MNKSWIPRALMTALLILACSSLALANIPNPDSIKRSSTTQMRVQPDEKAKEAKLIIPRQVWQQMKAQLDGEGSQNTAAFARIFNMTGAQTIMSGLFLSLAFAFAGLWLVRSRRLASAQARAAALALALLLSIAGAATLAYANAGPPPSARSLTTKILSPDLQWWGAYGRVKVEIVDEGDEIVLVLPKGKDKPVE